MFKPDKHSKIQDNILLRKKYWTFWAGVQV